MSYTGYNPGHVKSSLKKLKEAYEKMEKELTTGSMKTSFVDNMKVHWCSKQAQDYFKITVKTNVESLAKSIYKTYASVYNAMSSAGEAWAKDNEESDKFPDVPSSKSITFAAAETMKKAAPNGDIGMDCKAVEGGIGNWLATVKSKIDSAADTAVSAVNNSGFLGGNQQANLTKSLKSIKTSVGSNFDKLKKGIKSEVDAVKDTKLNKAGKIADAFNAK